MADMTTIKGRIKETIYPNGTGAITAESHQALLLEMVDDINEKKQDAEKGKGLVSDAERMAWNNKADKTGRYPDLSVGFADDLVGRGESVPAEFSFRASGGKSIKDGRAWIKRLKGNSVVWNMIMLPNQPRTHVSNGITGVWDGAVLQLQGTIEEDGYVSLYSPVIDDAMRNIFALNHKYAVVGTSANFRVHVYSGVSVAGTDIITEKVGDTMRIAILSQSAITAGTVINESIAPRIYDLTQMFQAGNEPTTIEEFYARKPIVEDEFAYNEGEVIHMTAEGIKSVGDNAWDEEWEVGAFYSHGGAYDTTAIRTKNFIKVLPNTEYYINRGSDTSGYLFAYDKDFQQISGWNLYGNNKSFTTPVNAEYIKFCTGLSYGNTYKNDIMITLVHSGWKQDTDAKYQPYWEDRLMFDQRIKDEFPNGMSEWDMVYNKNGKGYIIKGMYEVKIKDLNIKRDAEGVFIAQSIPASANADSNGYSKKILSARFIGDGSAFSYNLSPFNVMYIVEDNIWMNGQKLASYLTVEDFIHDYGDEVLYYQLAEPTIIEYDEPFNLDYRVADFGTEEAIAEQPSAPISADIIYQFNAVDMIREHELEIAELQSIIATMQAQLASLTNKE